MYYQINPVSHCIQYEWMKSVLARACHVLLNGSYVLHFTSKTPSSIHDNSCHESLCTCVGSCECAHSSREPTACWRHTCSNQCVSLGSSDCWEMCSSGSMSESWQTVTNWLLLKQSTNTETEVRSWNKASLCVRAFAYCKERRKTGKLGSRKPNYTVKSKGLRLHWDSKSNLSL